MPQLRPDPAPTLTPIPVPTPTPTSSPGAQDAELVDFFRILRRNQSRADWDVLGITADWDVLGTSDPPRRSQTLMVRGTCTCTCTYMDVALVHVRGPRCRVRPSRPGSEWDPDSCTDCDYDTDSDTDSEDAATTRAPL